MEEYFKDLTPNTCLYTDFVVIGGDGLINQFINGVYSSKYRDFLLEIPMCHMPGGSWNATACDTHGKIENHAATNVLRGEYFDRYPIIVKDALN